MALVAVSKIGRVNEAESSRRKQLALFALAGGGFDQLGGIPFTEINLEPFALQPALEQVDLRGLARAIEPLNGDQPAWEIQFRKGLKHRTSKLRNSWRMTIVFHKRLA